MATIKGYAAVFYDGTERSEFQLGGDCYERIMPGAFDEALRSDDIVALFNHDPSQLLGRNSAGTLELSTDSVGLRYSIPVGDTAISQEVGKMQARGDLRGSSFAFTVRSGGESIKRDGERSIREVESVHLFDVGPVTYPAYSGTEGRTAAGERRYVTDRTAVAVSGDVAYSTRSAITAVIRRRRNLAPRLRVIQIT